MTAPFGIALNKPLDQTLIAKDLGQKKFAVSPPKPHPSFVDYYAQDSRSYGVVWLKSVSNPIDNDAFGESVRALHSRVSAQLESRYGRPEKVDILKAGALWEDDRDWVMSLVQNERFYFHSWNRKKGANLPDELDTAFLSLLAYDANSCAVTLEYASVDAERAENEADQDLSDLL